MTKLQRVLIMAGGTGGHVFPGLAIAQYLRDHQIEVHWLGTAKGLEAELVPKANVPFHLISIQGVRGKGIKSLCLAPGRLLIAMWQAARVVLKIRPDVVIGMGGFVSGPGALASFLLRKKLIIHEQNAKPGLTNLWLARIANKVLMAFPDTFPRTKAIAIGNPVRKELIAFPPPEERTRPVGARPRLLVMGGSLGAMALNTILPEALALLSEEDRPEVLHQTGTKHFEAAKEAYQKAKAEAELVPFIHEMDKAYLWADIVLCRAGALTITELCAVGLGAILVPYPYAVDDHQTANANFMVKHGAALLLRQSELTSETLATLLKKCCVLSEKRMKMAKAAYQLRQVDATERTLTFCREVCH